MLDHHFILAQNSFGELATVWTIRASMLLYVIGLSMLLTREASFNSRLFHITWTVAFLAFVVHVLCAFQFHHAWSHSTAYQHTADQTKDVVGIDWGGGVYFNYAFLLVWFADLFFRWNKNSTKRTSTGLKRFRIGVHVFMGFIAFNATVVFATGYVRWIGVAATIWLIGLVIRRIHIANQTSNKP